MSTRSFLISSILPRRNVPFARGLLTFVYALPVHTQIAQRLDVIVKELEGDIEIILPDTRNWVSTKPGIIFLGDNFPGQSKFALSGKTEGIVKGLQEFKKCIVRNTALLPKIVYVNSHRIH